VATSTKSSSGKTRAKHSRAPGTRKPKNPTAAEHAAAGAAAREAVPAEAHAQFAVAPDRPDPEEVLARQAATRVPDLVPIRYGRMLVSPFTFYRGAAAVMSADLAATPVSGLIAQLCGDAHLANFGLFASPERRLMFDVNDFDETYPGPWEWDVKRLTASLEIAARESGFNHKQRHAIHIATVSRYQAAMTQFAGMHELDVWYARADVDEAKEILSAHLDKGRRKVLDKAITKAHTRDSLRAFDKLTGMVEGRRRIIADPPLIVPIGDLLSGSRRADMEHQMRGLVSGYRKSVGADLRELLGAFEFVDMARKVVGVGSVGTRCWIILMRGRDDDDPLFLQVKEAQRSVLAEYGGLDNARYDNEGERVVIGQRLMQAAGDIFLGWQTVEGIDGQERDFYVRQLADWKGSIDIEHMVPDGMSAYGELCGWTLARAHARTGNRIAIAAYLGQDSAFAHAIAEFSAAYADQNERDYAGLQQAERAGRIAVQSGL
jgi:uncharacterized protein (DUF2252 family)